MVIMLWLISCESSGWNLLVPASSIWHTPRPWSTHDPTVRRLQGWSNDLRAILASRFILLFLLFRRRFWSNSGLTGTWPSMSSGSLLNLEGISSLPLMGKYPAFLPAFLCLNSLWIFRLINFLTVLMFTDIRLRGSVGLSMAHLERIVAIQFSACSHEVCWQLPLGFSRTVYPQNPPQV